MQRFPLAGYNVHRVGFGAMQLPGTGRVRTAPDRDQALAVLRRAVDSGVDHIDTAAVLRPRRGQRADPRGPAPYPENLALVSKVGARRDDQAAGYPTPNHTGCASASRTTCAASGSSGWPR